MRHVKETPITPLLCLFMCSCQRTQLKSKKYKGKRKKEQVDRRATWVKVGKQLKLSKKKGKQEQTR
jgi:hypothetical protein